MLSLMHSRRPRSLSDDGDVTTPLKTRRIGTSLERSPGGADALTPEPVRRRIRGKSPAFLSVDESTDCGSDATVSTPSPYYSPPTSPSSSSAALGDDDAEVKSSSSSSESRVASRRDSVEASGVDATDPKHSESHVVVGREEERRTLKAFLERCTAADDSGAHRLTSSTTRSLYVSGGPGTGKTCSVRSVVNDLTKDRPHIRHFAINCMTLSTVTLSGLFDRIAALCGGPAAVRELRGHTGRSLALTSARQIARLNAPVVLVVDEVDQLVKRSGSVETGCALETLFSLPFVADMPPMAIIGIANAVDLLNRSVAPVSKGLATSLLFEPYTAAQLRDIMTSRFAASKHGVTAEKNLGRVGMELRVRQVAKHSGDCRRLLTSCNQAIAEVVAAESASLDNTDVACALAQNGADALKKAPAAKIVTPTSNQNDPLSSVMHLPIEQQMLLCALAGSKAETARLSLICISYKDLCRRLHQPPNLASKGSVGLALSVLEDRGLLVSHAAKGAVHGRSTPRGSICGDRVVELAVSREALRKSIARVNPLLERCMSD